MNQLISVIFLLAALVDFAFAFECACRIYSGKMEKDDPEDDPQGRFAGIIAAGILFTVNGAACLTAIYAVLYK